MHQLIPFRNHMNFSVEYVKVDGVRGCCRCVMNEMQWILIRIYLGQEYINVGDVIGFCY